MTELLPLEIPPGVQRVGTRYQCRGRWYDTNLVRWVEGRMRPVGGWAPVIGTGLFIAEENGVWGFSTTPEDEDGDLQAELEGGTLGVDDEVGGGVPLLAMGLGGQLTTSVIRTLFAWRGEVSGLARLAIGTNAEALLFTQGVQRVISPADLVPGTVDAEPEVGAYGEGAYGAGAYGVGDPAQGGVASPGIWHFANFGDYLVAVLPDDGRLLYWDGGESTLMVEATSAPTGNVGVVVTPERFVVVLRPDRRVQGASRETLTDWDFADPENTAFDLPVPTVGRLICARPGRNETLIWAERELFALEFLGGDLVYSIKQVGTADGPVSPNAVVVRDGVAYWMAKSSFFMYNGIVQPIPCEVHDAIFGDLNETQREKCFMQSWSPFGEILIGYPSRNADEPDRYALWNPQAGHWALGELVRTAAVDRGVYDYPMMAGLSGFIYDHERGFDHDGVRPFAESGPVELGDGDRVMSLTYLIPDEATLAGQVLGSTEITLYGARFPTATERERGPYTLANPTPVRLTARQVRVRVDEVVEGDWRFGNLRLEATPGGRR